MRARTVVRIGSTGVHRKGGGPTGLAVYTGELGLARPVASRLLATRPTHATQASSLLLVRTTTMVCYQDVNGNATAQRNARGKHYVVLH